MNQTTIQPDSLEIKLTENLIRLCMFEGSF